MICKTCNTINEPDNDFCVKCGSPLRHHGASVETEVLNFSRPSAQQAAPATFANMPPSGRKRSPLVWVAAALGLFLILIVGVVAAFLIYKMSPGETFPDHLGMFVQSDAKDRVDEIRKQDFSNALDAKTALLKDESLPALPATPNLILYADSKDINVNDIRLVQIDTIKDDGTFGQLPFQTAIVDGKPEMRRLRVPDALAAGKYAFTLLDGFINEGKHKMWAFQVKNSPKGDNGDALKTSSIPAKPKPTPSQPIRAAGPPIQQAPLPPGGNYARSSSGILVLRSGPGQEYSELGHLARGEVVEVLGVSSNQQTFQGKTSNFTHVRRANGQDGWAFSYYLTR